MTEVDQFSVPTERASAPMDWLLECSACERSSDPQGLPTVCPDCGQPWLVCYPARRHPPEGRSLLGRRSTGEADTLSQGMWRYRRFLPLLPGEAPVSLGEGGTPLLELDRSARDLGFRRAIHALIHETNVSRTISGRSARTFRRYALFSRQL